MGIDVRTTEHYLPLEGMVVAEVAKTELGPEIQRINRAQLVLTNKRGGSCVIHLSHFRDAFGRSLEQVIGEQSVELHQLLDEAIAREVRP